MGSTSLRWALAFVPVTALLMRAATSDGSDRAARGLPSGANSPFVAWREGCLVNPYAANPKATVRLAPVMEQVFWVEIGIAPEVRVEVRMPAGIKLLDSTKPGRGRTATRFYFRAERAISGGEIVFSSAGATAITVPLTVKTYRQDIEEQIALVPGIDRLARKRGRSYYTDRMIATAKTNMAAYPSLAEDLKKRTRFDGMNDAELWNAFPSWSVPRQVYGTWPCPHCGKKIFKHSGFYAWSRGGGPPFKSQCPDCKRYFPSNDYANDDFTGGEYPDDGWGYDPGSGKRKDLHAWIAYYNHHAVWLWAGYSIRRMALRSLLLGDRDAAHRVGVLLARMAYIYPGLDYGLQQPQARDGRAGGRALADGNWERNTVLVPALCAYDAIFDAIPRDRELVQFLQGKDPSIRSGDDVRALLDTYLVQLVGWDWMRRWLSGGDQGSREQDLAEYVLCANMGASSDRWLDELFTHAWNTGVNRGGFDDETQINTLARDGSTLISGLAYTYGRLDAKSDMAEILSRIGSAEWGTRCNMYDPVLYPKFHVEFDLWPKMVAAGQFGPSYGDVGDSIRGNRFPKGIPAHLRTPYARAYRRLPRDGIARALYKSGRHAPPLFEPDVWPAVETHVRRLAPEPPLESRVLDGIGFVFLESRPHATDLRERAAIALRYGYGRGHAHQDNLNIEMWTRGTVVAPELGYPCWAHPLGNTSFVAHHNTGMIDRTGQYRKGGIAKGAVEMFAGAPEAAFADVSAEPNGFANRVYRRAVCLADAPGGNVYLFDVFRMAGGAVRTYCFHGPAFDAFETNLTLGPEEEKEWCTRNLLRPQTARTDSDVWADWSYDKGEAHMRLRILGQAGRGYVTAVCGKPDISPLRYLFAEDERADGASEFVALWQPHTGTPFIREVERLVVEGARAGEFAPVAVRVRMDGDRTDTFIYTAEPESDLRIGEFVFRGRFGYWSEIGGKMRCAHLANGRTLAKGRTGILNAQPSLRTRITAVDLLRNTVTLADNLPADGSLSGKLIHFRNGPHRTAYHIDEVRPPGYVVGLDLNGIIFRAKITEFSADKTHLVSELAPRIPASGGATPHGYYDGALATGEDLKAHYRVTKTDEYTIYLDRPIEPAHFPDVDRDGRRMVLIYDLGPGDEAVVYNSVFMDATSGKTLVKLGRAETGGTGGAAGLAPNM